MRSIIAIVGFLGLVSAGSSSAAVYSVPAAYSGSAPASYPASAPASYPASAPASYPASSAPPYPAPTPYGGNSSAIAPTGTGHHSPSFPTGIPVSPNAADSNKPIIGGLLAMAGLLAVL